MATKTPGVAPDAPTQIKKAPGAQRGIDQLEFREKQVFGQMLQETIKEISQKFNLSPEDAFSYAHKLLETGLREKARLEAHEITPTETQAETKTAVAPQQQAQESLKEEPRNYQEMLNQIQTVLPPEMDKYLEIAKKADPSSLVGSALTMVDAVDTATKIHQSDMTEDEKVAALRENKMFELTKKPLKASRFPSLRNVQIPTFAFSTIKQKGLEDEVRNIIETAYRAEDLEKEQIKSRLVFANRKFMRVFAEFVVQSALRRGYPREWIEKFASPTQSEWIDKYSNFLDQREGKPPIISEEMDTRKISRKELEEALGQMEEAIEEAPKKEEAELIPEEEVTTVRPSPFATLPKQETPKKPVKPAIIMPEPREGTPLRPPGQKPPRPTTSTTREGSISTSGPARFTIDEGKKEETRVMPTRKFQKGQELETEQHGRIIIDAVSDLHRAKVVLYTLNTEKKGVIKLTQENLLKFNPKVLTRRPPIARPKGKPPTPKKPPVTSQSVPPSKKKEENPEVKEPTPGTPEEKTEGPKKTVKMSEVLKVGDKVYYKGPKGKDNFLAKFKGKNKLGQYEFTVYNGKKGDAPMQLALTEEQINSGQQVELMRSKAEKIVGAIETAGDVASSMVNTVSGVLYGMGGSLLGS